MVIPPALQAGDTVYLLSTARKINRQEIAFAVETLQSWGLEVRVGSTIGASDFQFAGTDALRAADFQQALEDPSVKAILCARGGYGTLRVIDQLDFRPFLKQPKWICGFSDITVLHTHLLQVFGGSSIHSTMPLNFQISTPETLASLQRLLFGQKQSYEIAPLPGNRAGVAEGILCGGNLSLLLHLSGSASDLDTRDKILFLEEIDEYLYHLDRMVHWLGRSGKLEGLRGMVVGHFSGMKNLDDQNPFGQTAYQILRDAVEAYDFPVCFGFPAGHEPDNRAFQVGGHYRLTVNDTQCTLQHL